MGGARKFKATLQPGLRGGVFIDVPFDPDEAWGDKATHHITGRINGCDVRGPLTREEDSWRLQLGPAWLRDRPVASGAEVDVVLSPEGPQRDSLAPDLAEALEQHPTAGAFWDSLATFYRTTYLRWLDGAARRPAVRKERVEEWIALLTAGRKTRD